MYGSVDYDSDSVRNAYHHSSWYNVEFGIDCFLWSYDGGYNAGCVEITDSDHAWSVVLVIVMTRIDNDDGLSAMMMIKMSLVFRCTGPPSGTSRCCLSVVTVLSSSHRPWELPASLRPFPLLIRESIFYPYVVLFQSAMLKNALFRGNTLFTTAQLRNRRQQQQLVVVQLLRPFSTQPAAADHSSQLHRTDVTTVRSAGTQILK